MRPPGTPYTQEEIRSLHLKGAVYIRMSTEMQTESPENQERQIRAYAEQYGIEIVKVYADLGISGMMMLNKGAMGTTLCCTWMKAAGGVL